MNELSRRTNRIITITGDLPAVDDETLALYVEEALWCWAKGGNPHHPLFEGIRVRKVKIANTTYIREDKDDEDDKKEDDEEV